MTLHDFIGAHRDELIRRCRAKVAQRSDPAPTEMEIDHGVPLFLTQLGEELAHGQSETHEIRKSATENGHDRLLQHFSFSQVVHGYGDICQSIADLALEIGAPITTDDFRTMNRCLDDAIAGAVTEYARAQDLTRDGESKTLRTLIETAIVGFDALQSGKVGFGGSTGNVVDYSLKAIRTLVYRQHAELTSGLTNPHRDKRALCLTATRNDSARRRIRTSGAP
jgi:hypothetical protein